MFISIFLLTKKIREKNRLKKLKKLFLLNRLFGTIGCVNYFSLIKIEMNYFTGISVIVLAGLSIAAEFKIPDEKNCPNGFTGLVPHPTFCPLYYICNNGDSELYECPDGLYYNPIRLACDFKDSVPNCEGGTRPPTTSSGATSLATSPVTPVTEPTLGPSTTAIISTTTSSNYSSEPTIITTSTTERTTPGSGDLTCPDNSDRFYGYPDDCTRFYFCQGGVVTRILSCNPGLWFRFSIQACQTPWGSTCTG